MVIEWILGVCVVVLALATSCLIEGIVNHGKS